jgi:hypothetical protein
MFDPYHKDTLKMSNTGLSIGKMVKCKMAKQYFTILPFYYFAICAVASTGIEPVTQGFSVLCSTI